MLQFHTYNEDIDEPDKGKGFFEVIRNLMEIIDFDSSFPEA